MSATASEHVRLAAAAALAGAVLVAPPAWTQPQPQPPAGTSERVRVERPTPLRERPSEDAPETAGWAPGVPAVVMQRQGRWAQVRLQDGRATQGWVFADGLRVAATPSGPAPGSLRAKAPAAGPPATGEAALVALPPELPGAVAVEVQAMQPALLRAGAGERFRVLDRLVVGEPLQASQREGSWVQVERQGKAATRSRGWVDARALGVTSAVAAAAAPVPAAPLPAPEDAPFLLQVMVPLLALQARAADDAEVVAQVEIGVLLVADRRLGDWYRVQRANGDQAWVRQRREGAADVLAVDRRRSGQALEPVDLGGPLEPAAPDAASAAGLAEALRPGVAPAQGGPDLPPVALALERRRPTGGAGALEPRRALIDPTQAARPAPSAPRDSIPVRDRWRIVQALGVLPYNRWDPYNPNPLRGDLPVFEDLLGPEWFVNVSAISDSLYESRSLPVPVGSQSALRPGALGSFGNGRQATFAQTLILNFGLIKGNTVFRPPDYEYRIVPVVNFNRTMTEEVRLTNIDPVSGPNRNDGFVGFQELFFDKHLRDVSERYDFDSLRVGVQPFTSDFRGFLFVDQPFGVRLFGTRDNNQYQYNLAWFRRFEKDTNSGLNDILQRPRDDDVFVFNLYRQDFPVLGVTTQGTILRNSNREGSNPRFFNGNGFLERPAVFGSGRPYDYDVTWLGLNADGHYNRWNLSLSGYLASGNVSRGQLSGQPERVEARFGAAEVSRDFSWIRLRTSALYASGDRNPFDAKAQGFDAVLENPLFAGADTSYWIRQAVPLVGGGGTTLSMRNGLLASLRTSREHGQANFTNPGLRLIGIGADVDLTPQVRLIGNLNRLAFDNLSSLATLRNQRLHSNMIGHDASVAVQYRPLFIQNVVINVSLAVLFPGAGLRELYGNALDSRQYSAIANLILTY